MLRFISVLDRSKIATRRDRLITVNRLRHIAHDQPPRSFPELLGEAIALKTCRHKPARFELVIGALQEAMGDARHGY
jgi:hypothetical protein